MLVLISIMISGGILSALGFKMTLVISEVIPFLVLAVGIDNIFIIVDAYHRSKADNVQMRVVGALENVGPGIFLSAFMESMVFCIATLVDMPAIRIFSVYAALAVFVNFLLQITCFVAVLTLDSRRQEVRKKDYLK
jgi:Niemann-Pick C1 protein